MEVCTMLLRDKQSIQATPNLSLPKSHQPSWWWVCKVMHIGVPCQQSLRLWSLSLSTVLYVLPLSPSIPLTQLR